MTAWEVLVMAGAYALALVAVAYFTRATARRIAGALAGGAVAGWLMLGVIALGRARGWWRVSMASTPGFLALFYLGAAISCSPIYLVTWRVARRFGGRGLAVCLAVACVLGPPRDYLFAAVYPRWMVFEPGVIPVLAVAATYVAIVGVGHAAMRLVAGPAREDRLSLRTP